MDLFTSLNNINNNESNINKSFNNKKNKNIIKTNSFDIINKNKFTTFIPQHQINIIYTSINKNNKIKNIGQYNNNILLNKIIKLSYKNDKLEKIITLLKIIISDLKKEKQKIKTNGNIIFKPFSQDNLKNLEIEKLKAQIEHINIINKEKISKLSKKINFLILENYQLKKEIHQKNEEFKQIQKRLEITEKRVKETLFNIKYYKFKNNEENSNPQKILINKEENEILFKKSDIKNENRFNKEKLKDKNLLNSSFKDIESTYITSFDTLNNTNIFYSGGSKNIINIKDKIE